MSDTVPNCTPDFWKELEEAPGKEPFKIGKTTVYACEMSADDWVRYQIAISECSEDDAAKARRQSMAFLIVHSTADANGKLLFTIKDIPRLMNGRWKPLADLYALCLKVNRMDIASVDETKKNSEAPALTGSSDSPATCTSEIQAEPSAV